MDHKDCPIKNASDEREYQLEKEVQFDGLRDFVFCSQDISNLKEYDKYPDVV